DLVPTTVLFTHETVLGNTHLVKKDLIKVMRPGHVDNGLDGNAWCPHIDEKFADPLMLGHMRIGAGNEITVVCQVRKAGPDLLPTEDVIIAFLYRLSLQTGEVGASVGFAHANAKHDVTGDNAR